MLDIPIAKRLSGGIAIPCRWSPTLQEQSIADNVVAYVRVARHDEANTGSVYCVFTDVQVFNRCAGGVSNSGGVTDAQVVARDHIDDVAGSVKAVHLPVSDQAAGQAAAIELVLIVQRDFCFAADLVPDTDVVECALKRFSRFKSAANGILFLAQEQSAAGVECRANGMACARVNQFTIQIDAPGTGSIVPAKCQTVNATIVESGLRQRRGDKGSINMKGKVATGIHIQVKFVGLTRRCVGGKRWLSTVFNLETCFECQLAEPAENRIAVAGLQIRIVAAIGIQLDAAGQVGRRVVGFDQIVQRDREGFVISVGCRFGVGDSNGDVVRRQGIGVQQRSIGHSNLARAGVDLKGTRHALRLDGVRQRVGCVEDFIRVPFDDVEVITGSLIIPSSIAADSCMVARTVGLATEPVCIGTV